MARKKYGIKGANEVSVNFSLGNFKFRAEFSGGEIINTIPASYTTYNEVEQFVIEKSQMFGKKIVLLEAEEDISNDEIKESASSEVFEEFTTVNEVVDLLKSRGIPHQSLRNQQAIKSQMLKNNIECPNVIFE